MHFFFPKVAGGNSKTGILTSTSSSDTCPTTCPLKGKGCYARLGNLGRVWNNVSNGKWETSFVDFLDRIKKLPRNTLWRHNQAGDLPGINLDIDREVLFQIVDANMGRRGFTYTHKPLTEKNVAMIREANQKGFTINISVEKLETVDSVMNMGLPVAIVLPLDTKGKIVKTPKGKTVLVCPQQRNPEESCATCGLCANSSRSYAIGFIAHGTAKKMADSVTK